MKISCEVEVIKKAKVYALNIVRVQGMDHDCALLYIAIIKGEFKWDVCFLKALVKFVKDWKANHNF